MSSTLSFLDQFNAPSTEGGKRLSIYTPKHTHVSDSTLLMLLLSNPTDVFNKLKAHNPEATNATDRAALEAYLSARRDYDEAVKAADEAIDHHKRLLRQQDDRVLTELIRLDNLKVAHHFQPLLPRSIRARHNKFIPIGVSNVVWQCDFECTFNEQWIHSATLGWLKAAIGHDVVLSISVPYIATTQGTNISVPALQWVVLVLTDVWIRFLLHTSQKQYWAPRYAHLPFLPPSWLRVKALSTPSTPRTSLTSTSLTVLPLSFLPVNNNCALIACLDRSSRITSDTRPSEGPNIRSAPAVPTPPDPRLDTPVLSLPAPVSLKLLPAQVKEEEIPISLQTLHQSQSLTRVRVKKESRSPSLHFTVGPHRRTRSPPRLQSLSYVTPPPGFLQRLPFSVPPPSIMSSPVSPPDKETLKHLLPLRYDGKTVIECNRFLSQLRVYWIVNMSLTTIELKVQVALSLLDGDARTWATLFFAQLASVHIGTQGITTPFANEAAFATALKAHFGNLDDEAAAQVELAKLCADKAMREKRTAAEFSTLFKGPADQSGYGDLELRDKYLSGIPSCVYRKIELETFTTWEDADKRATEHQCGRRKRRFPQ
ncbi:predicted protein [Postia placenta Mad-698-R]|nr:predicted protein [Postia placenta Mad-698-R]